MPPGREGSVKPGRLSSVSRMIKSSGGSVKFTKSPMNSRTVSREQSMVRSTGPAAYEDDDDEIISPPKSRARVDREAEVVTSARTTHTGAEEEVEEDEEVVEDEEVGAQSWRAQLGYDDEPDDTNYGGEYDDYNEYNED